MSSKTTALGFRLLKENDVTNYGSINQMLSRMDVYTGLALETTALTAEPLTANLQPGQAWAVAAGSSGPFWGNLADDAICIWSYGGETSGQFGTQPLRWHAIPSYLGAFAFNKATGTFVTYNGDDWVLPSKNKAVNVTFDKTAIAAFSGTTADVDHWAPIFSVDSLHRLLEVHTHITYNSGLTTKIPMPEFVDGTLGNLHQPALPYIRPIIRGASLRSDIPTAADMISGEQGTGASDPSKWHIPSEHGSVEPLSYQQSGAFSNAAAMTGFISKFDSSAYPQLGSGGGGILMVNLSDLVTGDSSTGLDEIETLTLQVTYAGF